MNGDSISTWTVITVIGLPVLAGAFTLLWNSQRENVKALWGMVNSLSDRLAAHKVECEKRFASTDDIKSIKDDLDKRLDRLEGKLDSALLRN